MSGGFVSELKRRNVIRVAGLYLVASWLIVQVAATLLPAFEAPAWSLRAVVVALAIAFVPSLVFSWVFEFTPEGLKRESEVDRSKSITETTARRMEHLIVAVLALALGYFAFDKFVLLPRRDAALQQAKAQEVAEARKQGGAEALVKSYGDKSIAVLPFVNMSSDKEQEYFSDGISEELLNQLAKIHELRVIARTSSFAFKGKEIGVAEIAKQLNVAHILEGSIRKAGNTIRITAQLIRAADSSHLWSETYDRDLADIFAVQDEISVAVVTQLKLKLLGAVPKAKVVDPQAYALHLQARRILFERSAGSAARAIPLLKQALEIDPGYAAAWVQLSAAYNAQALESEIPVAEGNRLARAAAETAVALDPNHALAHARLGRIEMDNGDLAAAARHFTRALALAPDDSDVLRNAAVLLENLDRIDASIAIDETLVARDPLNVAAHGSLGFAYAFAGRSDEAIASLRAGLALSPESILNHLQIGVELLHKGRPEAALVEIQREPSEIWRLIGLPLALRALGRKTESSAALSELVQKYGESQPYNLAYVYAHLGDANSAFAWIEKAIAINDSSLAELPVEPLFAPIKSDARWLPTLSRIGKAPEQLAAIEFSVTLPASPQMPRPAAADQR